MLLLILLAKITFSLNTKSARLSLSPSTQPAHMPHTSQHTSTLPCCCCHCPTGSGGPRSKGGSNTGRPARRPRHRGGCKSPVKVCVGAWLTMSGFVSVGSTPQMTDIFVCRRHVRNVVLTRRQHSVMSANFWAVGVVSVRPVADTHSYIYVGISTDEIVTTHKDEFFFFQQKQFY